MKLIIPLCCLLLGLSLQSHAETDVAAFDVNVAADVSCLVRPTLKLSRHPALLKNLVDYNKRTDIDLHALDEKWSTLSPYSAQVLALQENASAALMRSYINLLSLHGEGMLVGLNGGLAAATNKTTDFWQGDEAQFFQAIKLPAGEAYIGAAQPDQSSHTILVKISVPVFEPTSSDSSRPVGVLIIGLDAFVVDFRELCKKEKQQ